MTETVGSADTTGAEGVQTGRPTGGPRLSHQMSSVNSPVRFTVGTSSPPRVSACQPYDALVSTPAGMVPIGELAERAAAGTKVYDAHGVTRLVATQCDGVQDVLRVHTTSGHTLDVTAAHLVWRVRGQDGRFVPAGDLRPGDQLEWCRRGSFGEQEIDPEAIAEAALAGQPDEDGCCEDRAPEGLFTAPLPVVTAYLRSLFHAGGYVATCERTILLGLEMGTEELIRGVQSLLARFGIFAQVAVDAHQDVWGIRILDGGDRLIFADEVGFADPVRAAELEVSFELPDLASRDVKRMDITTIEHRGAMLVYDIRTESGEYLSGNVRVHDSVIEEREIRV